MPRSTKMPDGDATLLQMLKEERRSLLAGVRASGPRYRSKDLKRLARVQLAIVAVEGAIEDRQAEA
jgi:hypothetical protein